jgi:hypothetical protein
MSHPYFSGSTPRQRIRDVSKHIEHSSLLECDAVLLGKYFPMLHMMAVPLSSGCVRACGERTVGSMPLEV